MSEPSDMRFLGATAIEVSSDILSSAATDEHIEVIPVLVADSEEPYRCQTPSVLSCHFPFCDVELADIGSNESVPADDMLESSSSRGIVEGAGAIALSDIVGRVLILAITPADDAVFSIFIS